MDFLETMQEFLEDLMVVAATTLLLTVSMITLGLVIYGAYNLISAVILG